MYSTRKSEKCVRYCEMDNNLFSPFKGRLIRQLLWQDYDCNEMVSGALQLPRHTLLVLDETTMGPGQLQQQGCLNLQQVTYESTLFIYLR